MVVTVIHAWAVTAAVIRPTHPWALSTMSTSPQPRRSARERTQAQSLAAEMEYRRLQAADQALMRRLALEPLQYDSASDSDESEGEPEDDPS